MRRLWAAVMVVLAGAPIQAQDAPGAGELAFEVVSIRPRNDGVPVGSSRQSPDGSLTLTNVTTGNLIGMAYSPLEYHEMSGFPEWATTERYDVIARAPALPSLPTSEQRRAMIRALLADRYQMRVRTELREVPAFDLVLDRQDGTLGPGLRPSDTDCDPPTFEAIPEELLPRPRCRVRLEGNRMEGDATLAQFAGFFGNLVGRAGVDKTGLTGIYHITFESSTQPFTGRLIEGLPSAFTALREQLGLRVEPSRTTVEVLIIDRLERPSEN